ncbi:hypothetical protein TSTA_066710 [Talaromyces stipitatus ATCC 10500]|uniref:Uncharacterized protein n=1 Tax=Talaromyces stipitatus (strain ATCC 10500 / CBS 375.48 / QM 6759 / NRRL 1006) TaxID=441959 RepID=B8LXE4_TALSN|nr:uncharacterized protein TSTA_066710 [Talaromyces stipitatus ATCC 10500]EED23225.1 hypothetical protein TSTA_066710 [Talaromyces stipitatus ATCC 10500]
MGDAKAHLKVSFSGINNSRVTLPLSVEQLGLPEQNRTGALFRQQVLLDTVVNLDLPTQVILDVEAQILELINIEIAQMI